MTSDIYWIRDLEPLRLAIVARPRGGEWLVDEVAGWASCGIQIVACLLHTYEIDELDICDEEQYCKRCGIDYRRFPIADRGVPDRLHDFLTFTDALAVAVGAGSKVAIHCRAGIGRSSLVVAAIMLRLGVAATDVLSMISKARGLSVPDTPYQAEWLRLLAQTMAAGGR